MALVVDTLVVCQIVYWTASGAAPGVAFVVSLLVSLLVAVTALRHTQPRHRPQWRLIVAGATVWIGSLVVVALRSVVTGSLGDWSLSALLSLLAYLMTGTGMAGLARKEGMVRDAAVWLESIIGIVGFLLLWWIVSGPSLLAQGMSFRTVVANLLPVGDAVLVAGGVVLLGSRTARDLSSRALVGAVMMAVVGDLLFGAYSAGRIGDTPAQAAPALWMVEFALIALGAVLARHDAGAPVSHVSSAGIGLLVLSLVGPGTALAIAPVLAGWQMPVSTVVLVLVGTAVMTVLFVHRLLALVRRIERQSAELEATARTDELTRLPNRRAGSRLLEEAIAEATQEGSPLSLAIVDLDHFKLFNDSYGHLQGDRLLRAAGLAWSSVLGARGTIYRYGGEEFVVILPGDGPPGAEEVLALMRMATPKSQSFSAGIATMAPGDDVESLIGRADASLYAAKAAGRGRTIASA
ncbi:GGDEF domain-containing protein [Arsenicicoccus sp. oral taxon 190]|uniref:GGDEF domain-containing protein n=1 Tax=Arsenicicoccus sp. oral taxon 190 TaxID=1658671 RepID=UPI00067D7D4A|nr:GGDEF domain-containing protein [Arsenicicoccus sp. oral taxon 190]